MNNKKFNDLENNQETKKIVFFVFYIIFFIFIFILLRNGFSAGKGNNYNKYNSGYNKSFSLKKINNNNYHYIYKILKNNESISIEGNKYNNKEEFVISGEQPLYYYKEGENTYLKNSKSLKYEKVSTKPLEILDIISKKELNNYFIQGTYVSRTQYFDNKNVDYNYEISTSTLLKYLENVDSDIDDTPNKIIAKTNKDGLYQIELDFTNYFKFKDSNIYKYEIIISYTNFDNVSNIIVNK